MAIAAGLTASTEANLKTVLGNAAKLDHRLAIETELAVSRVGSLLVAAIRREFKDHDAKARDRYQKPGHVHTLDTLKLTINGRYAEITMGGASVLIWKGWKEHIIKAKDLDGWLIFKGEPRENSPEGWTTVKQVTSPAYSGDDYVSRAIASIDMSETLGAMLGGARVTLFQGILSESGRLTETAPPLYFGG